MSWVTKLYETYESVIKNSELSSNPAPYFHAIEGCHIEITLDENGNFKSAQNIVMEKKYGKKTDYKKRPTIIPITPKSLTGRTSGAAPYPLAEKIQYCAQDYVDYGGLKASYFSEYLELLKNWAEHKIYSHWKVKSVLKYIEKGCVVKDLIQSGILYVYNNDGKSTLITKWKQQTEKNEKKPALIQAIIGGDQGNAVVRWCIEKEGYPDATTWFDNELIISWQNYQEEIQEKNGLCQILGIKAFLTTTHPKGIYPQAANSKLISTPTDKGYLTYLGRFTNSSQPVGISFEVSQKAHNALSWLIERQGKLIGSGSGKTKPSMLVCWAISGKEPPDPLKSTLELISLDFEPESHSQQQDAKEIIDHTIDIGLTFSASLRRYMEGYQTKFDNHDSIVILGLDSATDGRMAVTYYQELFPKQYIDQITCWHEDFAWFHRHKQDNNLTWPISAPAPRLIMEVVYGATVSDSLKKNMIERILPCIVENRPLPIDLLNKAVRQTSNRSIKRLSDQYSNHKTEQAAWEKHLGITCSIYRGFSKRDPNQTKEYEMALEETNNSRDYLYGRLLAIAEHIEEMAMFIAQEKPRSTQASRLMQRFSNHPFSTWKTIEEGINPYQQRLKNNIAPLEAAYKRLLEDVYDKFSSSDFSSPDKLSGEYLLSYHLQRKWLREHKFKQGLWILRDTNEIDDIQPEGEE